MLRVAAPRVPAVSILVPCLQANQPPIGSPRIDVSFCQCRLKRDRGLHRIRKTHASIALPYGDQMAVGAREIEIVAAHRRRRKNLATRRGMSSGGPRLATTGARPTPARS